jgi:hypothetical protein
MCIPDCETSNLLYFYTEKCKSAMLDSVSCETSRLYFAQNTRSVPDGLLCLCVAF